MAIIKLSNVRICASRGLWHLCHDDNSRYGATLLLNRDDAQISRIEQAMKQAAKDKWGDKAPAIYKQLSASNKLALYADGNGLAMKPKTKSKPVCLDGKKNPTHEHTGIIYDGAYVNVILEIYAQDNKFGKRVNAQLKGVMFSRKGERIGRRTVALTLEEARTMLSFDQRT